MPIGKLFAMVAIVGAIGYGAIWYIDNLPSGSPSTTVTVSHQASKKLEQSGDVAESSKTATQTETNTAVTTNNVPASPGGNAGASAEAASSENLDVVLAGFDEGDESYDDSSVDSSFSGSLSEGI